VCTLPGYPGGLLNYNAKDQLATDAFVGSRDARLMKSGNVFGVNGECLQKVCFLRLIGNREIVSRRISEQSVVAV